MAATKAKKKTKESEQNGAVAVADVLTLAEAAAYLRVTEADVVQSVHTLSLPGRQIGGDWRFLKGSLDAWLSMPRKSGKDAILAMAGKFKDDPFLEEITKEAYRQRGRPITEDGK